jgi:hypothetical protein
MSLRKAIRKPHKPKPAIHDHDSLQQILNLVSSLLTSKARTQTNEPMDSQHSQPYSSTPRLPTMVRQSSELFKLVIEGILDPIAQNRSLAISAFKYALSPATLSSNAPHFITRLPAPSMLRQCSRDLLKYIHYKAFVNLKSNHSTMFASDKAHISSVLCASLKSLCLLVELAEESQYNGVLEYMKGYFDMIIYCVCSGIMDFPPIIEMRTCLISEEHIRCV